MAELRPLIAIVGLLVVVGGLLFGFARLRGWRLEWWDRFFSPGRRKGSRSAAGESPAARPADPAAEPAGGPHASSAAGSRESGRAEPGRAGAASGRQTIIDLDFLPLLDPEDAVRAAPLDRELDMGDLGSVRTDGEDAIRPPRTRAAPAEPVRARGATAPAAAPAAGRRPASKPRRSDGAGDPRAASGQAAPAANAEGPELLIVLTIITPDERDLTGPVIRDALAAFNLSPAGDGMFHHYGNRHGPMREPVFSVANVLEPGVFDFSAMDTVATPGLCLFMHRPGPLPAAVAFDLMLDVGTRLSRDLEAVLCDDQRCRLTAQATQALRERVVHFALRHERGAPNAG